MQFPYTDHPFEAMLVAQVAAGGVSTVVLLGDSPAHGEPASHRGSRARTWLLLACIWASIVLPLLPAFIVGMGMPTAENDVYRVGFEAIEVLLVLAAMLVGGALRTVLALVWVALVAVITRWLEASNWEACALHTAAAWVIWGIAHAPRARVRPRPRNDALLTFSAEDGLVVLLGTVFGAAVSTFLLERGVDGSDEWAYTYQAGLLAKGRVYGAVPPCLESLRSFWVFWRDDRMFAQYQPGWPLFMVPFVWTRTVWLAGPLSFGLLGMFGARLARLATYLHTGREDVARSGGRFAAFSILLANTLLINGGSRFPHIFVAALWCVAIERTWVLLEARTKREALTAAAAIGFSAGWLVATRAPEGALTVGILVLLARGLVKRKVSVVPVLLAGVIAGGWLFVLLAISKAQTGHWGQMPYALTMEFYPWNKIAYSFPLPYLAKWHFPLAAGTYSWWPLAPAFGLAGCLLGLRSPARRVVGMVGLGSFLMLAYYASLEAGRGTDFGYGPRYQLQTVVPMAIGGSLLWAHANLLRARARKLSTIGLALSFAGVVGVSIWTFPHNHQVVADSMRVELAIPRAHLGRAIVLVPPGVGRYGDLDQPRNLPVELYDAPVLTANTRDLQCLLHNYPDRAIYRAEGRPEVHFVRVR